MSEAETANAAENEQKNYAIDILVRRFDLCIKEAAQRGEDAAAAEREAASYREQADDALRRADDVGKVLTQLGVDAGKAVADMLIRKAETAAGATNWSTSQ